VVSAVESLSDRVLAILDKGHTRADIVTALGLVRAAGMSLRPTFVAFTPWTTIEDYLELCAFIRAHHLDDEVDPIQLAIRLLLPPGSLLLARPELGPHLGALDEGALAYRWSHPDPRMDRLATEVMAICERAAAAAEDPGRTFVEIHTCAARIAGIQVPERSAEAGRRRTAPPRLSEAWFCCAEPTTLQLRSAGGDHT